MSLEYSPKFLRARRYGALGMLTLNSLSLLAGPAAALPNVEPGRQNELSAQLEKPVLVPEDQFKLGGKTVRVFREKGLRIRNTAFGLNRIKKEGAAALRFAQSMPEVKIGIGAGGVEVRYGVILTPAKEKFHDFAVVKSVENINKLSNYNSPNLRAPALTLLKPNRRVSYLTHNDGSYDPYMDPRLTPSLDQLALDTEACNNLMHVIFNKKSKAFLERSFPAKDPNSKKVISLFKDVAQDITCNAYALAKRSKSLGLNYDDYFAIANNKFADKDSARGLDVRLPILTPLQYLNLSLT